MALSPSVIFAYQNFDYGQLLLFDEKLLILLLCLPVYIGEHALLTSVLVNKLSTYMSEAILSHVIEATYFHLFQDRDFSFYLLHC